MDSQTAEEVPVEPERTWATWTDAIRATLMPGDHGVSDEEICELLNAVADGKPLVPLLAARKVSLPMYCVWKEKYRQMSLEQLRTARSRERWRVRGVLAGLLLVAVVGGSGIVVGLARAAQSQVTGANEGVASNQPPSAAEPASRAEVPPTGSTPPPTDQHGSSARNAAPAVAKAPSSEGQPSSAAPSVIKEPGYKIQVAAANTEQEGRAIVERLAKAGYPAYLLGATVNSAAVFRVRVGPFDTLESAQEIASTLRQDGFSGAWIAR